MKPRLPQHLAALLLLGSAASAGASCNQPVFLQEKQDASTIRTLESAWTSAYLRGDTAFMTCLLTSKFTEIMRNGDINHLSDELALAAKNKGKGLTAPTVPPISVLLQGRVAVAYGRAPERRIQGVLHRDYYADYYVWEGGAWRAFFAQWTPVPVPGA
jgi:hypothetical protein